MAYQIGDQFNKKLGVLGLGAPYRMMENIPLEQASIPVLTQVQTGVPQSPVDLNRAVNATVPQGDLAVAPGDNQPLNTAAINPSTGTPYDLSNPGDDDKLLALKRAPIRANLPASNPYSYELANLTNQPIFGVKGGIGDGEPTYQPSDGRNPHVGSGSYWQPREGGAPLSGLWDRLMGVIGL